MKVPAKSKRDVFDEYRARDRAAIKLMAECGCSISEAWLILLDREEAALRAQPLQPAVAVGSE